MTRHLRPGGEGTLPVSLDRVRAGGPIAAVRPAPQPARAPVASTPAPGDPTPLHVRLSTGNRVLMFSVAGGVGRTTVGLGLAHTLADARGDSGHGVAFVDGAMDHFSGVHRRARIPATAQASTMVDISGLLPASRDQVIRSVYREDVRAPYVVPAANHQQGHPGAALIRTVISRIADWWDITVCDLPVGPAALYSCGTPTSPVIAVARAESAGLVELGDALAVLGGMSLTSSQVLAVVCQPSPSPISREAKAAVRVLETRCAGVVELPFDKALALSQPLNFSATTSRSQRALSDIAGWVMSGVQQMGRQQ